MKNTKKAKNLGIVDFDKKGNVVRFYIGDTTDDYWGDDWNDSPYDCNAGTVYNDYVIKTIDIAFPYDCMVLEPADNWRGNCWYSKEDLKNRKAPCIIVVPEKSRDDYYSDNYFDYVGAEDVLKFFYGDGIELVEKAEQMGIKIVSFVKNEVSLI